MQSQTAFLLQLQLRFFDSFAHTVTLCSVMASCLDMLRCVMQVGILRRGKYFKGKKAGKGNAVNEVCHLLLALPTLALNSLQLHACCMTVMVELCKEYTECTCFLQGDKVKKGQIVAYIEQLGTFVPVEVRVVEALILVLLHASLYTASCAC